MVILCSVTAFPSLISTEELPDAASNAETLAKVAKDTHLHLQSCGVTEIGEMCRCPKLSVLYLYDNKLTKIQNLNFCPNLTHLYLQNNKIRRLENLSRLTGLQKLFLSNNCISILEGLENNRKLEELHIDHQALDEGESFDFSPVTTAALSSCLIFLDIAGNKITDLMALHPLKILTCLRAGMNDLTDTSAILGLVKNLPQLAEADFHGNPGVKIVHYREMVILANPNIQQLDGKEIKDSSRQFLLRMKESRSSRTNFTSRPSINSDKSAEFETPFSSRQLLSSTNTESPITPHPKSTSRESTSKYVLPG